MELNQRAWRMLSEDERTALSLQHGMDKSSWQSGEIMSKSHYKYLEIKYRAEFFLKLFTEHLELYEEVIPDYVTGDKIVLTYFNLCISKRLKPIPALSVITQEFGKIPKLLLTDRIIQQFKKWAKEDNVYNHSTMNLVKEFDRWNNFRILPKEIQEPSAYKRRVKNSYKKQIKTTCGIHVLAIDKIKKLYETTKSPSMYLPLISENKPIILRLKINKGSLGIVNTIGIYTFKNHNDADFYIQSIFNYIYKGYKQCTDGLDFWPKYRDITQRAYNYQEVMKITPSRKYLQYAMQKLKFV